MYEGRLPILRSVGKRHPTLNSVHMLTRRTRRLGGSLGMSDPLTCRHPIHIARMNGPNRSEAVAMFQRTGKKISHRCQRNVRMRPDIDSVARRESGRPQVIEKI